MPSAIRLPVSIPFCNFLLAGAAQMLLGRGNGLPFTKGWLLQCRKVCLCFVQSTSPWHGKCQLPATTATSSSSGMRE